MNRYYYDPAGRRRPAPQRTHAQPTLNDFRELRAAYEKLIAEYEHQGKELAEAEQALQIKSEALHKQTEDLKNLEAELLFAKAALQQEEEKESADGVDWADRYARLQAEFENTRKRWEQRLESDKAEARHRILLDMLPLADHLEMALKHAASEVESPTEDGFVDNIRATQRAFLDTLRRYGVKPIDATGEPFDPNLHEAVGQKASSETPEGAVAEVLQTGYQEGDSLLRPARVLVSTGSDSETG